MSAAPERCRARKSAPGGGGPYEFCQLAAHPMSTRHRFPSDGSPLWGPHDWEKIPAEEYRWQCRRPNCGAIYVGADPPDAGHGCPTDELAARRGPLADCLRDPCASPALCKRAARCAVRMNQEIQDDPVALDVVQFLALGAPCIGFDPGGRTGPVYGCKVNYDDPSKTACDADCLYRAVATAGGDAKDAAGVAGRDAPADPGRAGPAGVASGDHVGCSTEGAYGSTGAEAHGAKDRLGGGGHTDARGIPVASVAAVHVERIAATLRVAGVCSCAACTTFAVAHEIDVLPMLAPAIAGRFAPGHGPTPDGKQKKPDRDLPISHLVSVRRPRRGKK